MVNRETTNINNSDNRVYSIFVSSTVKDLKDYRHKTRKAILDKKCLPVMMEDFAPEPRKTVEVIEEHLSNCDAVILVAGASHGSLASEEEMSYVELEFKLAHNKGLPVAVLIMSPKAQQRFKNIDQKQRRRQDEFINRLKKAQHFKEFDKNDDFFRDVIKAVESLVKCLDNKPGVGFIKVAEHERSLNSKSEELYKSDTHEKFLKMLSIFILARQGFIDFMQKKEKIMKNVGGERKILNKVVDLLDHEMFLQPVIAKSAANLMSRYIERLHDFSAPNGFTPESEEELEVVLNELFGDTLGLLEATSIHSNHKELVNYKGYWEDSELGPFFMKKNKKFLKAGRKIKRVYVCDSLADVLAEEWFNQVVIQHVWEGALVKIVQVDEKDISYYEDFGIYEHQTNNTETYILLAPKEKNIQAQKLKTAVIADSDKIKEYKRKFETLWNQFNQSLEIAKSEQLEEAARQPDEISGKAAINDLFNHQIILRKMQRLDTKDKLLPESSRFVRKYQPEYAQALSDHIKKRFPNVKHLLYIGDTYKNDGTAIRNLQTLKWDVSGFICEPKLGIERLWFNSILYTNCWSDLVDFAEKARKKLGPQSLALFDIDQTLWAPKGIHDSALSRARIQAIKKLVDEYVDPNTETTKLTKARIEPLYEEISEVKYINSLTLDNEDYKAAICIFLALNVIHNYEALEQGDTAQGAEFFQSYQQMETAQFMKFVRDKYLPTFLHSEKNGEENMSNFMTTTIATVLTNQFVRYCETNNIKAQYVREAVIKIYQEMIGNSPVTYETFRLKELEESLSRTGEEGDFDDKLVLNKPAWDIANWLKQGRVQLLGLSDRPDEATFINGGESLLNAEMIIYGKSIAQFLN